MGETNNGLSRAEAWRAASRERRRGRAVPLTLKSKGIEIMISRPPIETWFGTAKLPEALSRVVVRVFDETTPEEMERRMGELDDQENKMLVRFLNRLVLESVIDPEVVDVLEEDLKPGQMALSELDDEDKAEIQYAVFAGVPLQDVLTSSGGEVGVDALETFPEGE